MITCDQFTQLALSFPNTIAAPHFDRIAFKPVKKKIFATLHVASRTANLKFSPADQSVFALIDPKVIYAVQNKWGLQGWTTFELDHLERAVMLDSLDAAFLEACKTRPRK